MRQSPQQKCAVSERSDERDLMEWGRGLSVELIRIKRSNEGYG